MKLIEHLSIEEAAKLLSRERTTPPRFRGLRMVLSRQGWLCWWCDSLMGVDDDPGNRPTREHLIPRHMGGKGRENIVAACFSCNQARGCSTEAPEQHIRLRRTMRLRAAGFYAERPESKVRRAELPNFGRDPDGIPLWAPQFGIFSGPAKVVKMDKILKPHLLQPQFGIRRAGRRLNSLVAESTAMVIEPARVI